MRADNVLLLFTFCQADDDISVICDDVTGSVGKERNLTCSVSLQKTHCCIEMYRFQYPEIYNDSAICQKELPPDSCAQRNSFTCSYTPTTAITQPFRFFLQTTCGMKRTQFIVDLTDPTKPEIDNEAPDFCSVICENVTGSVGKDVTFTCSVPQQCTECCIKMFKYYEIYKDSAICMKELPYRTCEQRNSFTCSYTPTTAITQPFRFLMETSCGRKRTKFNVNIKEPLIHGTDPEAPGKKGPVININAIITVFCSIIFFIFFIIAIVFCVKRLKNSNASGSQNRYERGASEEQTVMTTNV